MADPFSAAGGILGGAAQIGGFFANLIGRKKRQRHFEKREDSAIQRQAADMEKAGLSKTLAAGGGAQAGQVVDADIGVPDLSESMAAAADLMQQKQDISSSKAQEKLIKAQEERQHAELKNMSMELDEKRLDIQRKWADEQRRNLEFAHNLNYARLHGEPVGKSASNWMKDLADNLKEFPNTWGAVKDTFKEIAPNVGEGAKAAVDEALKGAWDKISPWDTPREKAEEVKKVYEEYQANKGTGMNPFSGGK